MHENKDAVTIGEFVSILWNERFGRGKKATADGVAGAEGDVPDGLLGRPMEIALLHGWAEPSDIRRTEEAIRRNEAARLLHEFLWRELGEADEEDWGAAKELKDLYDCRVCVAHVAQVYCKGIMTAKDGVFGMREIIRPEEAREMAARTVEKGRRIGAAAGQEIREGAQVTARRLSKAQAEEWMTQCEELLCVDVRTAGEYAREHLDRFQSIPLMKLLSAPEELTKKPDRPILVGCDGGYRSELAAECLASAGCRNVAYFGWESED